MKRRLIVFIFALVLFMGFMYPSIANASIDSDREIIPLDIVTKLDFSLISEIEDDKDTPFYDVIVACDVDGPLDYEERSKNSVDGLVVTKNWNKFKLFQSNLSLSQLYKLASLPYVRRIDNNTYEQVATMRYAKSYTHVTELQYYLPSLDGNTDGSTTSYSKDDIVIAILDTGIDENHYDLDGGKVIGWVDLIGDYYGTKHTSPYDDEGHGNHVASIAAGSGDANYLYRGVARYAALVGVKMLDYDTDTSKQIAIDALDWVAEYKDDYGIEIASCSWGFRDYGQYDSVAQAADSLVHDYDVIVVVAAGNEGTSYDTTRTPGTAKWVITVGHAIDPSEGGWLRNIQSGRGPTDDLRIKPDILAPGTAIMAARYETSNQYIEKTGSSMATPFVAGTIAILLDYDDDLANDIDSDFNPDVKQLLMASAVDVSGDNDPGKDNKYGAGRIDALDAYLYIIDDFSTDWDDAPLVISYQDTTWNNYNEPMWVCDDDYESDWYKVRMYTDWFLHVSADGDPDLLLKVRIYDRNHYLVTTSTTGNYKTASCWSTYSGYYYVRIWGQDHTGDYYDVAITTTAS